MPNKKTSSLPISNGRTRPVATWQDVEANDWVIKWVCRKLVPDEIWLDIAQDVRARIFEKLYQFRGHSSLSTWMKKVAVNECLNYLRTHGRKISRCDSLEAMIQEQQFDIPAPFCHPAKLLTAQDAVAKLESLPQLALDLRRLKLIADGYSYDEVAAIEGVNITTMKSRIYHSRAALQLALGPTAGLTI